MAHGIPTHEPPEFPDEEVLPEEPAPTGRQLLRMFLPVAAAIVVFITALLLVLRLLVIPAMERSDPAVQARALATIGALQTQEAVTRSQQALTPQPTPELTSTPRPVATAQPQVATAQPVIQPTPAPAAVGAPAATAVAAPTGATSSTTPPSSATPVQPAIDTGDVPASSTSAEPLAVPTVDPVAQAEVLQAYAHYWQQRTLAFRDLDPSLLADAAAGPELDALTSGIERLRSEDRAIRTHIIHHVVALPTAPGEAVVADEYEDLSVYVDFQTKAPIDPSNPDPQTGPTVKVRKVLQKLDGVWKVTASARYE